MSTEELEAFQVFAETLNFTKAAERLAISQPALHVKIQKISKDLGQTLYTKNGRNLHLTTQGIQLAKYARESLRREADFRSALRGQGTSQPVTLSAGAGAYLYLLGPALREFRQSCGAPLHLLTADRSQTLDDLTTGRAQVGVTVLPSPHPTLSSTRLRSIPSTLVVPKEHPLARKKKLSLESLAGLPLIVPSKGKPFREVLESFFSKYDVPLNVSMEANGWELMLHFTALGFGATIVNGCCRLPRECRGIELPDLPKAQYFVLSQKENFLSESALLLKGCLIRQGKRD